MRLFHSLSRKSCALECPFPSVSGPVTCECCPSQRTACSFKSQAIFFLLNLSFLTLGYLLLLYDTALNQSIGGTSQLSTVLIKDLKLHSCSLFSPFSCFLGALPAVEMCRQLLCPCGGQHLFISLWRNMHTPRNMGSV